MNRYGQVLERVAERTRIDPKGFVHLQDRRHKHQLNRRIVAALVALAVAGGGAWGALALTGTARELPPAAKTRLMTTTAQGVTISYPDDWTLVQLGNEPRHEKQPDHRTAWATLQLTNFSPVLDPSHLCPHTLELPAEGVLLYIQRDLQSNLASRPSWPSTSSEGKPIDVPCGPGHHVFWRVGNRSFEALIATGPKASAKDQQAVFNAFRSLDFRWIAYQDSWIKYHVPASWDSQTKAILRALVQTPKEVLASVTSGDRRFTFNVMPDPRGIFKGDGPTFEVENGDLGVGTPSMGRNSIIATRYQQTAEAPVSTIVGSATNDVARIEIRTPDGHVVPAHMLTFPSQLGGNYQYYFVDLDGLNIRSGQIVALDADGNVLQRLPV